MIRLLWTAIEGLCCFCVCVLHPTNSLGIMETGPKPKVSSDRLVKLGIEPATPDLQGEQFIHYITRGPNREVIKSNRGSGIIIS